MHPAHFGGRRIHQRQDVLQIGVRAAPEANTAEDRVRDADVVDFQRHDRLGRATGDAVGTGEVRRSN